jgi:hypothetical protein
VLSFHQVLGLKFCFHFTSLIRATYAAHLILIALIIYLVKSTNCEVPHYTIFCIPIQNIYLINEYNCSTYVFLFTLNVYPVKQKS